MDKPRGGSVIETRADSWWGLILAGGDGRRLLPLTRRIAGDERPKQFCRVLSEETILEQTVGRAAMLVAADHVLTVVVRAHERFYAPLLANVSLRCMVIQPENRGSAPAILYGLLRLLAIAPAGLVAIFPSDHYVSDDRAFMAHVEAAFDMVLARPELVVLLGSAPDTDESGYGWIEPAAQIHGPWPRPLFRVGKFWEKPPRMMTDALRGRGGLWNTFVMVAYPSALLCLLKSALPELVDAFGAVNSSLGTAGETESLRKLYAGLPSIDFSSQVLAMHPANLAVLPLTDVGWNDLGEPRRVMATLTRAGMHPAWVMAPAS